MNNRSVKYFKSLLQIVLQANLFEKQQFTREDLLRNLFESSFYISGSDFDGENGWGIMDSRYIDENHDWLFGFLCKIVENPNVTTLPAEANSLTEIAEMADKLVIFNPFFFNFSKQHIYTQSNWQISRSSNSASKIWRGILTKKLKPHIHDLEVQSIPEQESFWKLLNQLKVVHKADFSLFGPNNLNEERIRELLNDFQPTGSQGIFLSLKNYFQGLYMDSQELQMLLDYILRGGGKGTFTGLDKDKNQKIVNTESKLLEIQVTERLDKKSSGAQIISVLQQINNIGNSND